MCTGPRALDIAGINNVIDSVPSWPQVDLFPDFGIPPFERKHPGSTTTFGAGCSSGPRTAPLGHTVAGDLEIGRPLTLQVHHAVTGSPAFVYLGFSNQSAGGLPLPFDLGYAGAPGCSLLVDPAVTLPTSGQRVRSATVQLPHDLSLVGTRVFTQAAAVAPGANALGMLYSNGAETVVGG